MLGDLSWSSFDWTLSNRLGLRGVFMYISKEPYISCVERLSKHIFWTISTTAKPYSLPYAILKVKAVSILTRFITRFGTKHTVHNWN